MRLSIPQQAMLMRLWNAPGYRLSYYILRKATRDSLTAKGYLETVRVKNAIDCQLTQAGIRYCQTGKFIGE